MPRPHHSRRIGGTPGASVFKPMGVPVHKLETITMTLDEFEALRLADLDALYQEGAAAQMRVSRPTFGRIVDSARRKIADALVHGKALVISGGPVQLGSKQCCRFHDRKRKRANNDKKGSDS